MASCPGVWTSGDLTPEWTCAGAYYCSLKHVTLGCCTQKWVKRACSWMRLPSRQASSCRWMTQARGHVMILAGMLNGQGAPIPSRWLGSHIRNGKNTFECFIHLLSVSSVSALSNVLLHVWLSLIGMHAQSGHMRCAQAKCSLSMGSILAVQLDLPAEFI